MAERMEVRDTREWRGVAKVPCTWDSVRFLARQGFGPHPRRRVSWGVGRLAVLVPRLEVHCTYISPL